MQGDCLVNILLTSFIKPAAKHSPALSPSLCLYLALPLSCTHISSRGLTGKGYSGSTLRYNQRCWSNSLLSIYTHIQFVGTLRGVSGEVFVWLDHSGVGPPWSQLLWAWGCARTNPHRGMFFGILIRWIFPHTLAFLHKKPMHNIKIWAPWKAFNHAAYLKAAAVCQLACLPVHQQGDFPSLREVYRSFTRSAYETRADRSGCSDCAPLSASIPQLSTSYQTFPN